jgi:outer membrane lipopolysaccharide assembly protein LptE/RlpB
MTAMRIKLPIAMRAAIAALLLTAACGNDLNTAQGIAEEFVDLHYVKIELQKAKQYTVSVAQAKIDDEIRLTSGQAIDASTQKPRVNYTLLEKKEGAQRSTFLFEGKIQSDDGTSFTRKWSIATRKEGNVWRVSNFSESD